jgi:starch phosphorylase
MATILPRYNATRMLDEYSGNFYVPASLQGRRYAEEGFNGARLVSAWKARVRAAWPRVSARRVDQATRRVDFGAAVKIEVVVQLSGLAPQDIAVELLLQRTFREESEQASHELAAVGPPGASGEQKYAIDLKPEMCGSLEYRIRLYPRHALLTHRLELGLMYWV